MSAEKIYQGTLDAALEIGARRADTLRTIRDLILKGEKDQAWGLLLKHLGIDEAKTSRAKLVEFPRPAPERGK